MWFKEISPTWVPRPWRHLLLAALLLLLDTLVGFSYAAIAETHSADSLRAVREAMSETLKSSPYQQAFRIESSDTAGRIRSDIYAETAFPFTNVSKALSDPAQWCDILLLNISLKNCIFSVTPNGTILTLSTVRKYNQTLEQAVNLGFKYKTVLASPDYLEVELLAPQGPYGTSDFRILLQATSLPGGRSFLHFSYSYATASLTRLATQAYLATFGRNKVGFTVLGQHADGTPDYISGMRGLVERGAMRYFLALEAYLDALNAAPQEQFEKRLDNWYSATERFSRQLHEIDRATYLELKRSDHQRRQSAP